MQLNEPISKLANKADAGSDNDTTNDNAGTDDIDQFVDAEDGFFEEDEGDVYGDNVQFIVAENDDNLDDDMDAQLHEIGLMLNSTLASDYDGANAARLNAHFFNDWRLLLERQAIDFGFPNLEELLKSECMKEYVEQISSVNGVAIYGAVSKLANEHILRRVADCKLNENQRAEKRKMQRLMELKNPENARNFLEGKRRILKILLDLKAYEEAVDYEAIRNEYVKLYNVSLNASEHQRLFMNKSALKNFWRAFYREVILINDSPIRVKLRSPDIKIPEEIAEDIRLLANIDKIELPAFFLEYRPTALNVLHKGTAEYSGHVVTAGGNILKKSIMESKPAMDSEDQLEGKGKEQFSNETQCKNDIGNADRNSVVHSGMVNTMNIPVDASKAINMKEDDDVHNGPSESVYSNEDKYTGDEDSTDSSDLEPKVSRKYQKRKKKFKGNMNTFNIPSAFQFLQSGKRPSVAERAIQQSLTHSSLRERSYSPSSSSVDLNNRSSARINGSGSWTAQLSSENAEMRITLHCHTDYVNFVHELTNFRIVKRSERFLRQNVTMNNCMCMSNRFFTPHLRRQLNNLPFGSYGVPNSATSQSISLQENTAPNSALFDISTRENTGNYPKTSENVQKPFSSHSHDNDYLQEMQASQPNRFQQHNQDYSNNHATFRGIPSWNKEVAQVSKGTQTDENWLENLLDELECRNLKKSPLQKLIEVIELVVDIRSPNPVLLSSLPQIVGSLYGTPLNPEKDQNYRITWREIVRDHCSAEILIAPLPNGEEVLIKK
ncbi:Lipoxygenase 6, chloroplastic [Dirofilaria immitis]